MMSMLFFPPQRHRALAALASLAALLLCSNCVTGADTYSISSVSDFISFVNSVNGGESYKGTTVLLNADLSFSGFTFEPIGDTSEYFLGVFDGQGHVISNLQISSSSQYAGLFGHSTGLTIRNVVLDGSCSFINTHDGSYIYFGGLIGLCNSGSGPCTIENSVNMASVTFNGALGSFMCVSGIAGHLYSSPSHEATVKNCANYGPITHTGRSGSSFIGGIVGRLYGENPNYKHIYNCLNYGTITHNGTSSRGLNIGGIVGFSQYYTRIENCVSAGKISLITKQNLIGSIAGYTGANTYIKDCYFSDELSNYNKTNGEGVSLTDAFSFDITTFKLSETVSVGNYTGDSLIEVLNAAADYYTLREYSNWLLNKEKKTVSFIVNRKPTFTLDSQAILLPTLANEGSLWFDGWYEDDKCTLPLGGSEITEDKELHGMWRENTHKFTVTYEKSRERGEPSQEIQTPFGHIIDLNEHLAKSHCSIAFWETECGDRVESNTTMPAHDITLYAVWKCANITTANDFVDFTKTVNNGEDSFINTTVYLDADIDLAGKELEVIGKDSSRHFSGTFDGQGHVISNLRITSNSYRTGLFGYSDGLTIRNVVLDSSCSVTSHTTVTSTTSSSSSTSSSYHVYVGGLIGYCEPSGDTPCLVEDSVNMGSVSFVGTLGEYNYLYLGGIAGQIKSNSHNSYVKNCANYGSVAHLGKSSHSYVGGLVGCTHRSNSNNVYIHNSLNYGTITHNGTTTYKLNLGGISGSSYYTDIENCVSVERIHLHNTPSNSSIGGVVGAGSSDPLNVTHCFWATDPENNLTCGPCGLGTENQTSQVKIDASVLCELNDYSAANSWGSWSLLHLNGGRVNSIEQESLVIVNKHFPEAEKELHTFSGWFRDSSFVEEYDPKATAIPGDIYAKFTGNKYTVTLDVNGGNELTEKEVIVTFNSIYGVLPTPTREGYIFAGWFTEKNESVTSETIVTIPSDHTLYAHWEEEQQQQQESQSETPSIYVEITFSTKDLSEEEIRNIVRQFTDEDVMIAKIEGGESEGIVVIVEFVDTKTAKNFVESIKASSTVGNVINKIGYVSEIPVGSLSPLLFPVQFLVAAVL